MRTLSADVFNHIQWTDIHIDGLYLISLAYIAVLGGAVDDLQKVFAFVFSQSSKIKPIWCNKYAETLAIKKISIDRLKKVWWFTSTHCYHLCYAEQSVILYSDRSFRNSSAVGLFPAS